MKPKIYLDYAAATPVDPAVLDVMKPFEAEKFYNTGSLYRAARETKNDLEIARSSISKSLGAKPTEIIFTTGATESVNLAIMGVAGKYWGKKIIASAIEHHAVLECLEALDQKGSPTELIAVKPDGQIKLDELRTAIDEDTVLISIAYGNNEVGTIQPLRKISQLVKEIRDTRTATGNKLPLYLHTDASQAAGFLSLAVESLGVDLLTLSGSKVYGPHGSGILYVRRGIELQPIIYGGGQESGLRSGTQNVAAAVGLAKALELAGEKREAESARLLKLRDRIIQELSKLEDITFNGSISHRLPNNINLSVDGVSGEDLVLYLDEAGFQVSTGAACTIGRAEPSHVLLAIGLDKAAANSSLRVTLGHQTTEADVRNFVKEFPKVVDRLRQRGQK